MKTCSKCRDEKDITQFYKDRSRKDGVTPSCKLCVNEVNKAYILANPHKGVEKVSRWKKKNPDKHDVHVRKWQKNNPEKFNAINRKSNQKKVKDVSESYIRYGVFRSIKNAPKELIELKIAQIKLNRELKAMEQQT